MLQWPVDLICLMVVKLSHTKLFLRFFDLLFFTIDSFKKIKSAFVDKSWLGDKLNKVTLVCMLVDIVVDVACWELIDWNV